MTDVAVVTGASRGIGRAIAQRLAADGIAVALVARSREPLEQLASQLDRAIAIEADLHDPDAPARIVEAAAELGPPTILVNNAGTAPTAKFERTTDDILDEVLDLHVRAPFRLVRTMLPRLRELGRGTIVQLASTAGLRGFAYTSAYTAAKHAMVGMTRALACELDGSGIVTYAVCPGFVDTEITRQAAAAVASRSGQTEQAALDAMAKLNAIGRMHTPTEVADTVATIIATRPAGDIVVNLDQ